MQHAFLFLSPSLSVFVCGKINKIALNCEEK